MTKHTVPPTEARIHLEVLLTQNKVSEVARLTSMSERNLYKIRHTDKPILATTAKHIANIVGQHTTAHERIENQAVAEYARTAEGRAFIAKCRAAKPRQVAA